MQKTKVFKLTTSDFYTRKGYKNKCLWGEGITHSGTGFGPLCSEGYIHAYTNPLLAVLLNPAHVNFKNPVLWSCEAWGMMKDDRLKVGYEHLTTLRQETLPEISIEQKVAFGILCSLKVCDNPKFILWANNWISKKDRTAYAANAANAAYAAVYTVYAVYAANAAANAADAAVYAADAAVYAANSAKTIDFTKLAEEAMKY